MSIIRLHYQSLLPRPVLGQEMVCNIKFLLTWLEVIPSGVSSSHSPRHVPKAWQLPQPTGGMGPLQRAGVTSGAGFHHSETMFLASVRAKRGGEERVGKQSGWQ
jgi:hypothetical protein